MAQYDNIAEEYSQMLNLTKKYVVIPTFKLIAGDVTGKSALDLACGDGFFTRILAGMNPSKLVGMDISKELIKKAIEKEQVEKQGITYFAGDVMAMDLQQKFDVITAVYLLNYAETKSDLLRMCKAVSLHLADNGRFCTITTYPSLEPMVDFEYERRFTNADGSDYFIDGSRIKCEMREKGKSSFEFINYYWSRETYEECLMKAGFKTIRWVEPVISEEGIKEFGNEYWDNFRKNPSSIGVVCTKA